MIKEPLVVVSNQSNKKIKVNQLKKLGYRLGDKQIPLVSFCYLFITREMAGIILPQPFHYYQLHKIKNLTSFLAEQGIDE